MPFPQGTQLGHYTIESLLGTGGMGEVYLAHDTKLGRPVALKVLTARSRQDPAGLRRFIKEARAASALNHPNVVYIYEIEESEGVNFIALEYVLGETLRARMRRSRMTLGEALDVAAQVAGALGAAHAAGVIHRDIKPENIMLTPEGHVKVLDFGLAKLPEVGPGSAGDLSNSTVSQLYSAPGLLIGTISYMSPEQARGLPLDERTDIWSLGVVLYEMLAGRAPFEGSTGSDVIAAILRQQQQPLAQFTGEATEAVERVIERALSKEQSARYQTVREMHDDLRRLKRWVEFGSGDGDLAPAESSSGGGGSVAGAPSNGTGEESGGVGTRVTDSSAGGGRVAPALRRRDWVAVALLLVVVVAGAFIYVANPFRHSTLVERPLRSLKRVTFDQGLQTNPTWSPDGKYVAYSSDRAGNFDIWVQSVSGGEAIRITNSEEHEWQPDWSPDGDWVVFRSERDGGALYRMPAPFGGQPQRVSPFGYAPRWSPDGSRILFLRQGMRLYERPRVYVVSGDGSSPPREVLTKPSGDEGGIRRGALSWHPDGQRVSYWGEDKAFWTVGIDGGMPLKSEVGPEVTQHIREAGLELGIFRWSPQRDALYFEGRAQGVLNLWRIGVDPETLRWVSGPERLTASEGQDTEIAISRDGAKLAFTKKNQGTSIWLFPFDAQRGQIKGEGQAVTPRDLDAWFPDLSPDGSKLIYTVYRQGMTRRELWERSLQTSRERKISDVENSYPFNPRWSPDSTRIAYSPIRQFPGGKSGGSIALMDAATGNVQPLASVPAAGQEPWRDYVYDWSPDGRWVLASSDRGSPERWYLALFPLADAPHAESKMREVLKDPDSNLWAPRVSPDGRWVCFLKQNPTETASSVLYVIPMSGGAPVRITEDGAWADKPRWSPDGGTLYFIYNRDSYFLNVWGVRFDQEQGRPTGEPFRVTRLSSPSRMVATLLSSLEITLDANRLALPVTEVSGNVWIIENVRP